MAMNHIQVFLQMILKLLVYADKIFKSSESKHSYSAQQCNRAAAAATLWIYVI